MQIIEDGSGKDFEPKRVEAFKKALPKMTHIFKEILDTESAEVLKVCRKNDNSRLAEQSMVR